MSGRIKVWLERREFDKAFNEYLRVNKRSTAQLVEHTAKKVVTGFSPRSPSNKKVVGLRQTWHKKRATFTKIRMEAKQRLAQRRGTLRPPKKAVSKRAEGLTRSVKAAINWRSRRGTAWVQATMLYKNWKVSKEPTSKQRRPSLDRKHSGAQPPTNVKIRTKGTKPYVLWSSKVPGAVKGKYRRLAERTALRGARLDMEVYIRRKHQQLRIG